MILAYFRILQWLSRKPCNKLQICFSLMDSMAHWRKLEAFLAILVFLRYF